MEAFNQYRAKSWSAAASLRVGHVRYLHFPYPDAIAEFDQVPGIGDLNGGSATDYRDAVFVAEMVDQQRLGRSRERRAQAVDAPSAAVFMEAYGFYRHDAGHGWHVEGRLGASRCAGSRSAGPRSGRRRIRRQAVRRVQRRIPLRAQAHRAGIERRHGPIPARPGYPGTRQGRVRLFSQPGRLYRPDSAPPPPHEREPVRAGRDDVLVGEVRAVRIRTLWQQGYPRNEYEHRLEFGGATPPTRAFTASSPKSPGICRPNRSSARTSSPKPGLVPRSPGTRPVRPARHLPLLPRPAARRRHVAPRFASNDYRLLEKLIAH